MTLTLACIFNDNIFVVYPSSGYSGTLGYLRHWMRCLTRFLNFLRRQFLRGMSILITVLRFKSGYLWWWNLRLLYFYVKFFTPPYFGLFLDFLLLFNSFTIAFMLRGTFDIDIQFFAPSRFLTENSGNLDGYFWDRFRRYQALEDVI